jgi:acyl-CoA synthetase (AMP-forming)/AMP-acid ligase II
MFNLASLLHNTAARLPDKPGVILGDRVLRDQDLDRAAQALALKLIACDIQPGDRVALHFYNCPELVIGYFACFYAGAVAVPINTRLKAPEIAHVLEHSGASLYLGQPELFGEIEHLRARLPNVQQFVNDLSEFDVADDQLERVELPEVRAHQPAVILYTSGSTARPKGVVHSHASLHNAPRGIPIEANDVTVLITQIAHAAALFHLILSVELGATVVLVEQFDPDVVLETQLSAIAELSFSACRSCFAR